MVLFGQSSGPVPPVDPNILNPKGSLFLTRPSLAPLHGHPRRGALAGRRGAQLDCRRTLRIRIERSYPLAEAAQAHRDLESRRTAGKLLLIP